MVIFINIVMALCGLFNNFEQPTFYETKHALLTHRYKQHWVRRRQVMTHLDASPRGARFCPMVGQIGANLWSFYFLDKYKKLIVLWNGHTNVSLFSLIQLVPCPHFSTRILGQWKNQVFIFSHSVTPKIKILNVN